MDDDKGDTSVEESLKEKYLAERQQKVDKEAADAMARLEDPSHPTPDYRSRINELDNLIAALEEKLRQQ